MFLAQELLFSTHRNGSVTDDDPDPELEFVDPQADRPYGGDRGTGVRRRVSLGRPGPRQAGAKRRAQRSLAVHPHCGDRDGLHQEARLTAGVAAATIQFRTKPSHRSRKDGCPALSGRRILWNISASPAVEAFVMAIAALSGWTSEQKHVVAASFLGWSLDAFDFFLLVFVLKDIAAESHTDISNVT